MAVLHIGRLLVRRLLKVKYVLNYSYGLLGCIQNYNFIFEPLETFSSFKSIQFLRFFFNLNRTYFYVRWNILKPEHQNQSGLLTTLLCSVINAFFYITSILIDVCIKIHSNLCILHHQFVSNEDLFLHHKAWFETKTKNFSLDLLCTHVSVCSVINAFFYITPTGEDTARCTQSAL